MVLKASPRRWGAHWEQGVADAYQNGGGEGGTKGHRGERKSRRSGGELVGGEALTPLSLILGSGAVPIKPVSYGCCNQRVGGIDLPLFNCNGDDLEGGGGGAPFEQGKGMIHHQQRCFGVVTG